MRLSNIPLLAPFVRWAMQRPYTSVFVVLAILGGIWFIFFRSGGAEPQTFRVTRGEFVQSVSVSGTVKAAQDVDLAFQQSGRVGGVYVSVGDAVPAGRTLAAIESADVAATVAEKQAALESEEAKLAKLQAGSRPEDIQVTRAQAAKAHQDLANMYAGAPTTLADAYAKATDGVYTQLSLFFSNADSGSPQLSFSSSVSQEVVDVQSKRLRAGQELVLWQNELSQLKGDSLTTTIDDALRSGQAHLAAVADFLSTMTTVANNAITLPSGISGFATLKGYVSTALSEVNTASSNVNTAVSNIASQKILTQQLDAQLSLTLAGSTQQDIAAQAAQVAVARAALQNAQAQAAKTRIVAPFAGVITRVDAKTGQIASAGTSQISMIGSGTFQVESYIPEINIALIEAGDPAVITLDAYGDDVPFTATVVSIDPAETVRDGVSSYRTILEFDTSDTRIRSGMTANVRVTTDTREGVISIPQGLVIERDGKKYVLVQKTGGAEEREVTIGQVSSLGNVEILAGLTEGDLLPLPL